MIFSRLKRREFFGLLGGAVFGWPLAAIAKQPIKVRRIGVLMALQENDPEAPARVAAFEQALREAGWSKENNIEIYYRWGASDAISAGPLAKELVELRVEVILAHTTPATAAIEKETRSIPTVFVQVTDPVAAGLVASLASPEGNVTGFTTFDGSLGGKWLQLLKEIAPRTTNAALLYNPAAAPFISQYQLSFERAAKALSVQPAMAPVQDDNQIAEAVEARSREPGGGIIVVPDIFTANHRRAILSLVDKHRIPSIFPFRYWTTDGGLISYGIDPIHPFRQAAGYVDRLLRGEQPRNLPVQQPTKFEFAINLQTAKTLGLNVPGALLATADEVIE